MASINTLIGRGFLRILGLKVSLAAPLPAKCVIAVVPHTSNLDFFLGLSVRAAIEQEISFVGKKSLFTSPLGFIFKRLGGIPVDRSKSNNFVDAVADIFEQKEVFRLSLSPEGTRSKVDKLKSGFYYIAQTAQVPIVLCAFDFKNKIIRFDKPFFPSSNKDKDFEYIYSFFSGVKGVNPKNSFVPPLTK